jgi:hypothetical protein
MVSVVLGRKGFTAHTLVLLRNVFHGPSNFPDFFIFKFSNLKLLISDREDTHALREVLSFGFIHSLCSSCPLM